MIFQYHQKSIFYQSFGQGEPLLLIHGFLESSSIWEKIISEVSGKHKVITLDLPGHGKSENLDTVLSMETAAEIIHELLKKENIINIKVMGHSLGGYIALALVELYPDLVNELFLLNSTALPDAPKRRSNRNKALKIIQSRKQHFITTTLNSLFSETSKTIYQTQIHELLEEATQISEQALQNTIVGMRDRKDRTEVLANFSKPRTIIASSQDPIIPITDQKQLAKFSGSYLFILKGGHMSWMENNAEIVKILHLNE